MDVFFSDFDGYSESSSSDDQEDDEFMYGGQASSLLLNLEETIDKIDDFLFFERRYVHGDVVRVVKDLDEQMGRVVNVEMVVDLENVHGKKLKDVSSKRLRRIRSISSGDHVVAGPWVGRAEKIVDRVTILFDDGTKCEFSTSGEMTLLPISPDLVDDSQYPYYPGQRVKVVDSSTSKPTRWFCRVPRGKQDEGIICAVEAGSVYVNWLACALFGSERKPAPPSLQNSKDLTPLSCFSHSNWQLGDWCILPPSVQEIFVIVKTRCKVDVLWQDGSKTMALDSSSLSPVNAVDAHDFWPHQFVLEKGASDDDQNGKWGVVKNVDAREKIVKIKWGTFMETEETGVEETTSAYELTEHPDYSYCLGDLVFRLCRVQNDEDHGEYCGDFYESCIGIVTGFEDGVVEVKWAAGFTSKVAPHEIFRVEMSESESASPLLIDNNLEPNHEKSLDPKEKDLQDFDGDEKDCLKRLCDSTPFNVPRAAIGFFSSVVGRLFGSRAYTSFPAAVDHVFENGLRSDFDKEDSQVSVEACMEVKVEETEEMSNFLFSSTIVNLKDVRRFDVVTNCSNHHFFGNGSISGQVKRGWLKKVQQEWNILAKDLPETIYVRVFEERIDLLHAAIAGAPGTPYHDGLFFFDIFLPPEYPHEPPKVHYNSGGLRVNPNLYESGKVCLSLLNTWSGTGSETWNPEGSTVLQVLLSLQALVLNEKPYFNEAGYDQQVGSAEGEKNSCTYNENAFLMNCKSMLYVLRKPPKHFEELVQDHFKNRCEHILMACKAYLEGDPIGGEDAQPKRETENSTGFKIMLSKLYPKLVEAFIAHGFDFRYVEIEK